LFNFFGLFTEKTNTHMSFPLPHESMKNLYYKNVLNGNKICAVIYIFPLIDSPGFDLQHE
jgi:hypothetical protein